MAIVLDPAWTCEELAHVLCDKLVAMGKLKEKPAFIRTDREGKIAEIFKGISLDGAKMASFDNPGPLEMLLRKGTNGEVWVQQCVDVLVTMLPESAAKATKKMGMDDEAREELAAAKEKSEQRRQRLQENEEQGGAQGEEGGKAKGKGGADRENTNGKGGGGYQRDNREERGNSGWGERSEPREERGGWGDSGGADRRRPGGEQRDTRAAGGYGDVNRSERGGWTNATEQSGDRNFGRGIENMECYNCGQMGHSSRDCPEPRKETGKGKGKRGHRDPSEIQCANCKEFGHKSRDCTAPVDEEAVRLRLAAKAEKDAKRAER